VVHAKAKRRFSCSFSTSDLAPTRVSKKAVMYDVNHRTWLCETGFAARERYRMSRCKLFSSADAIARSKGHIRIHFSRNSPLVNPCCQIFPWSDLSACTCCPVRSAIGP